MVDPVKQGNERKSRFSNTQILLGIGGAMLIVAVAVKVLGLTGNAPAPAKSADAAPVSTEKPTPLAKGLTDEEVSGCGKAIAGLIESDLIKDMPKPGRIVVDENYWNRIPYKDKVNVLVAVSCREWRSYDPPKDKTASAYAYYDGGRLLTLTKDGVF